MNVNRPVNNPDDNGSDLNAVQKRKIAKLLLNLLPDEERTDLVDAHDRLLTQQINKRTYPASL